MEKDGVYYDEGSGERLVRPSGYNGLLYQKVTGRHKDYLKALGNIGVGKFVYYEEWIRECEKFGVKTNEDETPSLLPGTMTHGVFESRGFTEIKRDEKTGKLLYCLTEKGELYLENL